MKKVLVKVLFILMLCVGIAGTFALPAYSGPDTVLEEIREKYGSDCTYEKVEIDFIVWIFVYDGNSRLVDAYPCND